MNNAALIINLEDSNKTLKEQNIQMSDKVNQLKTQLNTCIEHRDSIEQYM